jgi:hypothetical protein
VLNLENLAQIVGENEAEAIFITEPGLDADWLAAKEGFSDCDPSYRRQLQFIMSECWLAQSFWLATGRNTRVSYVGIADRFAFH